MEKQPKTTTIYHVDFKVRAVTKVVELDHEKKERKTHSLKTERVKTINRRIAA